MNKKTFSNSRSILRCGAAVLLVYIILAVGFYFLAGEQLHLRNSRGNISAPTADRAAPELAVGSVIDQHFAAEIQRLETISVQWTSYHRPNTGKVILELIDITTGTVLMSDSFDMAMIEEGGMTTLAASAPIENVYGKPLILRIYSPDAQPGSAASPLMNTQETETKFPLFFNGTENEGTLCFSVSGQDYIWTGLHYWKFVGLGLVALAAVMLSIRHKILNGKRSYIVSAVAAVSKYRFLIRQLVARDFKTKYKRSVLGVLWSFLNPLLMMIVQYFVFSTVFKSDIPNYPVYLMIGIISFNFFSEACGMSLTSIVGNAGLITKVYMPKYIYPLTRVISSVINLGISMIPLIIVALITGVRIHKSALLALFFVGCLLVFSLGCGMVLSAAMVFFRDTQFLWGVLSTIWMYATPIFYPESILPDNFKFILNINPLYHFLKYTRMCVLDGISPEPIIYVECLLMALGALVLSAFVFNKTQDKFVLYL